MRKALCLLVVTLACKSAPGGSPSVQPPEDAGVSPSPPPVADAGTPAPPDAGPPPVPDAGPATPPDAGPDPHVRGSLGWGPFPQKPLTVYGAAQGLTEAPVAASVDEGENLWVVSNTSLFLLAPGAKTFRRYTAADGLHVGSPWTEPPDMTLVEGGTRGECFVGYYARDTNVGNTPGAHTWVDPYAHMGKMDQVLLQPDGSLKVNRYDLRNTNDGHYYETRTIMSMVYDHFQHPGNLYVGSNHGITRIIPAKYVPQTIDPNDPGNVGQERTWFADHVHAWTCLNQPCTGDNSIDLVAFGDWFGLAMADDGRLWMGGLYNAAAIRYQEALSDWIQSWAPHNPFWPSFTSPPVFEVAQGQPVNIHATAVTPDGVVWFGSGEDLREQWRGQTFGLASYTERPTTDTTRPPSGHFDYYDPIALGAIEYNILEIQALDDGRLVLGFPTSGLLVWTPGDVKGHRLTVAEGLPGQKIGRMTTDRMHSPPLLMVPTDGGLAVFRDVP